MVTPQPPISRIQNLRRGHRSGRRPGRAAGGTGPRPPCATDFLVGARRSRPQTSNGEEQTRKSSRRPRVRDTPRARQSRGRRRHEGDARARGAETRRRSKLKRGSSRRRMENAGRPRIDARSNALEAGTLPSHDLRRDPAPTTTGRERQEGNGTRKRARLRVGNKPLKSEPWTWQRGETNPQGHRWNKPSRSCETTRTAVSRARDAREPTPLADTAKGARTPRKAPSTPWGSLVDVGSVG